MTTIIIPGDFAYINAIRNLADEGIIDAKMMKTLEARWQAKEELSPTIITNK